ncbi:aminoglycoside phosphotransferase family protein [Nocardioides rubriscoriae]|uniref:aminoglycoside phosphotransferase family protein n=1 Tax=Nocardioides rubriscoriae TaxID=642762 RepID=UPI0011DFA5A8|nr:aminoglycoside phosphotransferase family protein [Nocardioides rubriscoriae]
MPDLTPHQRELLDRWLPGWAVVRDHSWGQVDRTVLEVRRADTSYAVKASGPDDSHLAREVRAHQEWLGPWRATGHAATLVGADLEARLLVTTWLPGRLVEGTAAQGAPATYHQAGVLLAVLHGQLAVVDPDHEARENARALRWLDEPHRIATDTEALLRDEIAAWPTPPARLVPTHGDWQPRNWVVDDDGTVRVIDLGRADLRTAASDLARLAAQDFRRDPALEAAFLEGYGTDPREPHAWWRQQVREAIGTAAWAHRVGDEPFEAQGHRMLRDALVGPRPRPD